MNLETNSLTQLPRGWVSTTIEELSATSSGGTPRRSHKDYYGGSIPWVKSGELRDGTVFRSEEFITDLGLRSSSAKIFPAGTLCIALYGATVGRLGTLGMDAATNQAVCGIFVPKMVAPKYLFHFLFSQRRQLIELGKGGAQPNISQDIIRRTVVPLAPLAEQHRIVAKVEELLTKLDVGVEELRKAQAQLKRYRQSVLKAAVTGELTREWREAHQAALEPAAELLARILKERREKWEADQLRKMKAAGKAPNSDEWKKKYVEPTAIEIKNSSSLPAGWTIASIDQVAECLDHRRIPINKKERSNRVGNIPYYGANGQAGWIDEFLFDEPLVLIVEDETFTGREKPFCYKIEGKSWVNNHAHVLRATGAVDADYLNYSLAYYPFTPLTTGTTGRKKLTRQVLMTAPYRLPPLFEQQQIVSEVERALSIADAMEKTIGQSLKQAERMRQSILKRAFEGKLVPQGPNDEPADLLLERIKIERAKREAEKSAASKPDRGPFKKKTNKRTQGVAA